jgi:hypothetical protein
MCHPAGGAVRLTLEVRRLLAIGLAATALAAVGCRDDGPSGTAFCGRLAQDRTLLTGGVATAADVDAAVTRYRELERLAPAAVREPWTQLTTLLEQAATIDLSTADGQRQVRELAYESQGAATEVATWAQSVCGIDLGAATTAPPAPTDVTSPGSTAPPTT